METRPSTRRKPSRKASASLEEPLEKKTKKVTRKGAAGSKKSTDPVLDSFSGALPPTQAAQMAEFRALADQMRRDNAALVERITSLEASQRRAPATTVSTSGPVIPEDPERAPATTVSASGPVIPEDPEDTDPTLQGLGDAGISIASTTLPVGALVPLATIAKIKQLDYIDFASLVPSGSASRLKTDSWTLSLSSEGSSPVILSNAASSTKKILAMPEWLAAWNIFLAVMGDERPDIRTARLCKHFQQVLRLYQAKQDWSLYDSEFRRLVAAKLTSWGEINFELLQLCQVSPPQFANKGSSGFRAPLSQGANSVPNNKSFSCPKGFCYKFH